MIFYVFHIAFIIKQVGENVDFNLGLVNFNYNSNFLNIQSYSRKILENL